MPCALPHMLIVSLTTLKIDSHIKAGSMLLRIPHKG